LTGLINQHEHRRILRRLDHIFKFPANQTRACEQTNLRCILDDAPSWGWRKVFWCDREASQPESLCARGKWFSPSDFFDFNFRQIVEVIFIQGEKFFCAGFLSRHRMQIIVNAPAANSFFSVPLSTPSKRPQRPDRESRDPWRDWQRFALPRLHPGGTPGCHP
jgi:hypothetical protein